jgi:ankyrin repeat protein
LRGKEETTMLTEMLMAAVQGGHVGAVGRALDRGADIEARGRDGDTALMFAAWKGHREVVECLLDRGAYIEARGRDGDNALLSAVKYGHRFLHTQLDVVKCLLDRGADIEARDVKYGFTAFMAAACEGHIEMLKYLLDRGADIEARDKDGVTALMTAAHGGKREVLECLLDRGADIDTRDSSGNTVLMTAGFMGYMELVGCLLDRGADIEGQDVNGHTALIAAAQYGRKNVVECLLDRGADIEAEARNGNKALFVASSKGHIEVVECLLDRGADIDAREGRNGITSLLIATGYGQREVVECLLDRNVKFEATAFDGRPAFVFALQKGHKELAELLKDLISASQYVRKVRRNLAVRKIFEDLGCEGWMLNTAEEGGSPSAPSSIAPLAKAMFRDKLDSEANFRLLFGSERAASVVHRLAKSCYHCQRSEIRSGTKIAACKGCRSVHYCSAACQKLAWPEHKAQCLRKKSAGRDSSSTPSSSTK